MATQAKRAQTSKKAAPRRVQGARSASSGGTRAAGTASRPRTAETRRSTTTQRTQAKKPQTPRTPAPKKQRQGGGLSTAQVGGITVGAVAVVLLAVYLIICLVSARGNTLRQGTTVNGVDIGGLTAEEAERVLGDELTLSVGDQDYASIQLDIENVGSYDVDLSNALGYDVKGTVEKAMAHDHGGSFLTLGARFLASFGQGEQYEIYPSATDAEQVDRALDQSGVLELDTTVQTTYELKEDTLDFTMGIPGVSVDREALVQEIMTRTGEGNFDPISSPLVTMDPDAVDLEAIREEIYAEPSEATIEVAADNSYTIVESVEGIDFDVAQAQEILSEADAGSVASVPLNRTVPKTDTETFKALLFRDKLGQYTTDVGGSAARRSNVKLAAQKVDGTILLPGEVFSYNDTVGQRTKAAGFQEAPAYNNGETVQELGGGVCQGSSTLYCACMYANLEIVKRVNHTYVSSYVPLGMDATVSWGGPDYQFRNNTDYPIRIDATYSGDRVTFKIVGTKTSEFDVKITSETLEVLNPEPKTVNDPTKPVGYTKTEGLNHTGYKVQTYRHVYDGDGKLIYEGKEAYSNYSRTSKTTYVGTKQETVQPVQPTGGTGSGTGGSTGGETGGSTGGETGGSTGGETGGSTGGETGGSTGGETGGNTGGETGGGTTEPAPEPSDGGGE